MKKVKVLTNDTIIARYYILIGDDKAIHTASDKKQWGFVERNKGLWNTVNIGDKFALYVTKPLQKIVGFGVIEAKFISNEITWPDELFFNKSIWKYRLSLKITLMADNWNFGIAPPKNIMLNIGRKLISKDLFFDLHRNALTEWERIRKN